MHLALLHTGCVSAAKLLDGRSFPSRQCICRPEKEAEQLKTRQKVRQAIMAGQMTDAQELLHSCHPDMLESATHPNLEVLIFFHCLHYIELIR